MNAVKERRGLLANAFSSPKWNSRITSANTTKKCGWAMSSDHTECCWANLL